MLQATIVTKDEELIQIQRLNEDNLKQNLTAAESQKEGFVTWFYPIELLQQMHRLAPSIIVKDENVVVGYALTTLKEAEVFHSDLQTMIQRLQSLTYENQLLFSYDYYCMGQICIHKNYRGKGVFSLLYQQHKEVYGSSYNLLITEVAVSNLRSRKAHENVGFKTIHTYHDNLDDWNVVVWDWK